jgi:hypothetical protein
VKITYTDVKPAIEALKELGRIAVIAMVPIIIDGLTAGAINWTLVVSSGMIAGLRAIDKFLHLEGKIEGNDALTAGLTRF